MVDHIHYTQEKIGKTKSLKSTCDLKLKSDKNTIIYKGDFCFDYLGRADRNKVRYFHELIIDKINGDIQITYKIETSRAPNSPLTKSTYWIKKNDFLKLQNLCIQGINDGEKKSGYWGVKYYRAVNEIFEIIKAELFNDMTDCYAKTKTYEEFAISRIYELIVDYHLYKKGIKGHNNVYYHILDEYPKKKWLKPNENKFLPAVLDGYDIKSKYFISELSLSENEILNIKALVYFCRLFGDNYLDYIKLFSWNKICKIRFLPKKYHACENESEKKAVVNVIKNWNKEIVRTDSPLEMLHELFHLREFLNSNGYDLKIKIKSPEEIEDQIAEWELMRKFIARGYMEKYIIAPEIVKDIETPIIIAETVFLPKILLSEDDFILEGHRMKNCMAKQFIHGSIHWYISLSSGCKRVDLQYRKASLVSGFAKANSAINYDVFRAPMNILEDRLEKYTTVTWKKEKIYTIVK